MLGLAGANIFSAVADATLMIVQWGKTRREVFKYGVGEITKFGGRIDGIILESRSATPMLTPAKRPKLTWANTAERKGCL